MERYYCDFYSNELDRFFLYVKKKYISYLERNFFNHLALASVDLHKSSVFYFCLHVVY